MKVRRYGFSLIELIACVVLAVLVAVVVGTLANAVSSSTTEKTITYAGQAYPLAPSQAGMRTAYASHSLFCDMLTYAPERYVFGGGSGTTAATGAANKLPLTALPLSDSGIAVVPNALLRVAAQRRGNPRALVDAINTASGTGAWQSGTPNAADFTVVFVAGGTLVGWSRQTCVVVGGVSYYTITMRQVVPAAKTETYRCAYPAEVTSNPAPGAVAAYRDTAAAANAGLGFESPVYSVTFADPSIGKGLRNETTATRTALVDASVGFPRTTYSFGAFR